MNKLTITYILDELEEMYKDYREKSLNMWDEDRNKAYYYAGRAYGISLAIYMIENSRGHDD